MRVFVELLPDLLVLYFVLHQTWPHLKEPLHRLLTNPLPSHRWLHGWLVADPLVAQKSAEMLVKRHEHLGKFPEF
jgi:hypothetical protein